ncbi:MAG: hypothetical protein HOE79_01085 [Euryarchaeota archaeon]|nr:hypothetical protein [Euryarchaeota archaeon]
MEPIGIAYKEAVANGIFTNLELIQTIKSFNEKIDIDVLVRPVQMLSQEELNAWYQSTQLDLQWLEKSSRHQFRWRLLNGRWVTSGRQISNESSLRKLFKHNAPRDLYIGTSAWLNPVELPRLKDTDVPSPILIDHLVVFDIDFRPFCYRRLERARQATHNLLKWLDENENLDLQYISYSGGKGFHLVLKDTDRSLFAIPEPREREQMVRESRQSLLSRVLEAGFPVDKTVTADTRRIIRLPGSLHGTTGWCCTRISREKLAIPLKKWKQTIPRHQRAISMPYWPITMKETLSILKKKILNPFSRSKAIKATEAGKKLTGQEIKTTALQVSSQVVGTKGRSALMAWLPTNWKDAQTVNLTNIVSQKGWSPIHHFKKGNHDLLIIPRAIPTEQLRKHLPSLGLRPLATEIGMLGHYWTDITSQTEGEEEIEDEIAYIGEWENSAENQSKVPWSATHLEVLSRLGVVIDSGDDEVAGRPEPAMRVVVKA